MAGDWIKMRVDLSHDPAVIGIAGRTGLDEDHVVGKLHKLWAWADQQTTDGNAVGVTKKWVDRYLCVDGFASAMIDVGWMVVSEVGIALPDFDKHNGQTGKRRALTTRRTAKHRNAKRNATSVTKALPEKRREDINPLYSPSFNLWWSRYPKKVGKTAAAKAYKSAVAVIVKLEAISEADADAKLLNRVSMFAESDKAKSNYCWDPATWLNQGHYDDDPTAWKSREKSNGDTTLTTQPPRPAPRRVARPDAAARP